jgi:hypothetical protein
VNEVRIRNSEYREYESTNHSCHCQLMVATASERVLAFAVTAVIGTFVLAGLIQVLRGFHTPNGNLAHSSVSPAGARRAEDHAI